MNDHELRAKTTTPVIAPTTAGCSPKLRGILNKNDIHAKIEDTCSAYTGKKNKIPGMHTVTADFLEVY